jgi:uncharacterized membrane protein
MNYPSQTSPFFTPPLRWALRVLAWLAFFVAAYLAWHAVSGTSVAACGMGDANSCDVVLSSSWAKWLGVPVAVPGLACYATLAALSVVLGFQNSQATRWVNTSFVLLAILAATTSVWFIGVQIFAIGSYCLFCLFVDLCGIAIGGLVAWSAVQWFITNAPARSLQASATGLTALKTALPARSGGRSAPVAGGGVPLVASRPAPAAAWSNLSVEPSLPIAIGGAIALLLLLVAGQLLSPAKTYVEQEGKLDEQVALAGTAGPPSNEASESASTQDHVAMRIPAEPVTSETDGDSKPADEQSSSNIDDQLFPPESNESADSSTTDSKPADAPPTNGDTEPVRPIDSSRERTVEFLNGTLKLDVYKHPLLGSPEAPHVMIEMVSYDCPHCREMHRIVERGLARYGGQVAVLVMPIPLEMRCNRLITDPKASHPGACSTARMALGVAAIRPQSFKRFHDWLMADKEKPPRADKIIAQAYGMVDRAQLRSLSNGPELNRQLREYIELYARLANRAGAKNKFGLPVQILGSHIMSGKAERDSDVFDAWEKHLGVTRR